MQIFCTSCRRPSEAQRCTVLAKVSLSGRPQRLWANRCLTCGTPHVAPDPTRSPKRKDARRAQRSAAELERAGQLPLFGKQQGGRGPR